MARQPPEEAQDLRETDRKVREAIRDCEQLLDQSQRLMKQFRSDADRNEGGA